MHWRRKPPRSVSRCARGPVAGSARRSSPPPAPTPDEARLVADHLVEANLVGHDSHGVIRIKKYVDWVKAGQVLPNRHARLVNDRGAAVLVDGDFGYGQVIGKEAMAIAAERAREIRLRRRRDPQCRPSRPDRRLGRAARRGRLRLLPLRQHLGLRHPRRAAWRPRPPPVGQSDRRRHAGRRRPAARPRHRHLGHRRGQDPGVAEQGREDSRPA